MATSITTQDAQPAGALRDSWDRGSPHLLRVARQAAFRRSRRRSAAKDDRQQSPDVTRSLTPDAADPNRRSISLMVRGPVRRSRDIRVQSARRRRGE
jgi:hypothetical protein